MYRFCSIRTRELVDYSDRLLVRVEVDGQQCGPGFTLTLANGRRIESSWRFAEADLQRLIRAAEA